MHWLCNKMLYDILQVHYEFFECNVGNDWRKSYSFKSTNDFMNMVLKLPS